MRWIAYAVVGAIVGIMAVGFILGIVQGMTAESVDDAYDPMAIERLNRIALVVGTAIGAPTGLGLAAWKHKR